MPRDISGNYTLPSGINPVISGTLIDVDWANPTMSDIATQLNNVLTRDGLLGPLQPLRFIDGTVAIPGASWAAETNTGFYREGSGLLNVGVLGNKIGQWTVNGLTMSKNVAVSAAEPEVALIKSVSNANFYGYRIKVVADTLSSWLLNATSGETRFSAGYTGWGGYHTWYTDGSEKMRLGAGGNLQVSGVNEVIRLTSTAARGTGQNYINFHDPSGSKGYMGYGSGSDDSFQIYNGLSSLQLYASGSLSMTLFGNGRVAFKNIHNVGPVTGTADQFLASGTYSMTTTNVANITSSAGGPCQWMRVGNVVTVSGALTFTPTSAGVSTQLRISLPIASDFTFFEQAAGVLVYVASAGVPPPAARIVADASANEALMTTTSDAGGGIRNCSFTFTYLVQ